MAVGSAKNRIIYDVFFVFFLINENLRDSVALQ
jgi:hypothetical protein